MMRYTREIEFTPAGENFISSAQSSLLSRARQMVSEGSSSDQVRSEMDKRTKELKEKWAQMRKKAPSSNIEEY